MEYLELGVEPDTVSLNPDKIAVVGRLVGRLITYSHINMESLSLGEGMRYGDGLVKLLAA